MPTLELLAARHEREGLQVLAINFRETDDALQRFLQSVLYRRNALLPLDSPG